MKFIFVVCLFYFVYVTSAFNISGEYLISIFTLLSLHYTTGSTTNNCHYFSAIISLYFFFFGGPCSGCWRSTLVNITILTLSTPAQKNPWLTFKRNGLYDLRYSCPLFPPSTSFSSPYNFSIWIPSTMLHFFTMLIVVPHRSNENTVDST